MKKSLKKIASILLTLSLIGGLAACGSTGTGTTGGASTTEGGSAPVSNGDGSVVNIGVTYSLGTLNPLLIDGALVTQYATSLLFLPLMELGSDMEYHGQIAESITTEDNLTFTVSIDPNAVWSDGEPITAEDVLFTALRLTDPAVGNVNMAGYAAFKGFDPESGFSPSGADEIEGIQIVDDHTLQFIANDPMSLVTFQSSVAAYLLTLPKHILGEVDPADLPTHEFFQDPSVISGPYSLVSYNRDHYIEYTANPNYFRGEPKIEKLNIKIVQGSQLYAGLVSGEIDLILPTTGIIPVEDQESVLALDGVTAQFDKPLTNQLVFINNATVPDEDLRRAMLLGIDRETIFNGLVKGNGELIDGFISSYSPYYTGELELTPYDPDAARALVEASDYNGETLEMLVTSGDSTFEQASVVIAANLAEIGINLQTTIIDINTLFARVADDDYDLYAMQYTLPPVDPYPDMNWMLGGWHYIGYQNDEVSALLASTQTATSTEELAAIYQAVDEIVQVEVPIFSTYVISSLGVVSDRLSGVEPVSFGTLLNIHEWTITG